MSTSSSQPQTASTSANANAAVSSSNSPAVAQDSQQASQPQISRKEAEEARKDRTLAEFLVMLDDYEPLVSACLIMVNLRVIHDMLLSTRFPMRSRITTSSALASNAKTFDCAPATRSFRPFAR